LQKKEIDRLNIKNARKQLEWKINRCKYKKLLKGREDGRKEECSNESEGMKGGRKEER